MVALIFAKFLHTLAENQPKTPSFHHHDSQLEVFLGLKASLFSLNKCNVSVAKKFTASSRLTMVLMTKILRTYPIEYSQKIDEL